MNQSSRSLRSLNLNQLPVLREVLRFQSITKAAEELNLSQPAVSNILKTLRGHFEDDLIVRDSGVMRRTPRGDELLSLLNASLSSMETAVQGREFDPTDATGPLRIAAVDNVIGWLAGPFCEILDTEAPNLSIQFVCASHQLAEDLGSGAVDMAVTSSEFINSSTVSDTLRDSIHVLPVAKEPLVCIARIDDVEFAQGLSLQRYLLRHHASYTVDPDFPHTVERKHIREARLRRSTRISTTSNQSLPEIVANSDCIAVVPISMAITASKSHPIQYRKPPMDLPDIEWIVAWHDRALDAPLVQWAKGKVDECARKVRSRLDEPIRRVGLFS